MRFATKEIKGLFFIVQEKLALLKEGASMIPTSLVADFPGGP
jgi:hypothetical protein